MTKVMLRSPTRQSRYGDGAARWVLAILFVFLVAFTSYSAVKRESEAQRLIRSALLDAKFSEAATLIEKEMAEAEEPDFYLYLLGNARFLEEKFPEAAAAFERLEEQFPQSRWAKKARFRRAACLAKLGDWKSAEEIYEEDVSYLVSPQRKDKIASTYLDIADRYFNPPQKDEKPDYNKAYRFYKLALEMGLEAQRREKILFLAAKAIYEAKNYHQALKDFQVFLEEYPEGKFAAKARYLLGHSYFSINDYPQARSAWQDLMRLLPQDEFAGRAAYEISRTYHIPDPRDKRELELGVSALERFIKKYPEDQRVPTAHFEIGLSYYNRGRLDDAVEAFASFLEQYKEKPVQDSARTGQGSEEEVEEIPRAKYLLGHSYLGQKKYDEARETWQDYVTHHPAGADWNAAQRHILEIDYSIGADYLAEKDYDQARSAWERFLSKNPLHEKAASVMFQFGQMAFDQERFDEAIDQWRKVVSKYPRREESSHAQFMIAETYERKTYDLAQALEEYEKVTWGSWRPRAEERIREMKAPHLEILTERTFRSNEPAFIKVTTRNLDRIRLKVYPIDLGAYFRKMHHTAHVEFLDIALVEPLKTWEISVKDFEKYKLDEQEIEIPIDSQGAVAVTVSGLEVDAEEAKLEASTLVIKSDLDIILKVSKRQVFAFAENMLTRRPYPAVTILFSNGEEIFCEGKTNGYGIFSKENETMALEELKDASLLRAFAIDAQTSAACLVNLEGLRFGVGFSSTGYIYTDRPAYRPGQEVNIRAVVRMSDGKSYTYQPGQQYLLEIQDPQGRILFTENVSLSNFGTISSKFQLDELAPVGTYKVLLRQAFGASHPEDAQHPKGKEVFPGTGLYGSGQFLVQRYKLEPVKVEIELRRRVYFRGEKVEGKIIAKYHYGEPVVGKLVEYYLGDERRHTATTDKNGQVAFTLETEDFTEERPVLISASLREANVGATETILLAIREYTARLSTIRNVFLSGEKFEVEIETRDAQGEKVSREMTLSALRREKTPAGMGEVLEVEEKFKTDEETGKATVVLALEKGGQYILRASGTDRFQNIVSGERIIFVSDEEDKTRLRILADRTSLKVGEEFTLNIHSRLPASPTAAGGPYGPTGGEENLCLVTFEGDWVIEHRLLSLKKGNNEFKFPVGHNLFPNFALSANVMDGNKFYEARTHFTVERGLTLAIKPNKETYEPGEEAEIEITSTDQLGNAVSSEVSLAMVDEALYFLFPDPYKDIRSFFYPGRREAYMRTDSSCVFKYAPETREVAEAVLAEAERLRRERDEAIKVAEIRERARMVAKEEDAEEMRRLAGRLKHAGGANIIFADGHSEWFAEEDARRIDRNGDGIADAPISPVMGDFVQYGYEMAGALVFRPPGAPPVFQRPREYFPETAYWNPSVITDENGKATIKLTLPDTMTTWRLASKGVTKETHLGQTQTSVVAKKDFFLDVKLPAILTEGDEPRILAEIHNSIGPAEIKITARAICGERAVEFSKEIQMTEKGTSEVIFDGLRAEGKEVIFEVAATDGKNADFIKRTVPVRPWGMQYFAKKGGTARDDARVFLALQPGRRYAHQEMRIIIGPTMERMLIDIALGQVPGEPSAGSFIAPGDRNSATAARLLAALFCRDYMGVAKDEATVDYRRLEDRIKGAASDLISTQNRDGGWAWVGIDKTSDRYVSSIVFWSLARAKSAGYAIPDDTLERGEKYLLNQFSSARAEEHEAKAIILHALSARGKADFAYANRLYRLRSSLSEGALAHLALVFINLERPQMAREILTTLEPKAIFADDMIYFSGANNDAWMKSNLETTALVVYALAQVEPKSPLVEKGIKWILAQRSSARTGKALGAVMAALTEYYGQAKYAAARYRLTISVNDKTVKTLEIEAASPTEVIQVPPELIKDGENKVATLMEGKGEYSYEVLLSAFSPDIKPGTRIKDFWVRRWYEPGHIYFEGREIPRGFGVLMGSYSKWQNPLTQLPLGTLGEVTVDADRYWYRAEERERVQDYLVLEEYLPAGATVLPETIRGRFDYYELGDGVIRFFFRPTVHPGNIYYRIVGYLPGKYRAFPSVLRSMYEPEKVALSSIGDLTILKPGQKSQDQYRMTPDELYHLGKAYFDKGHLREAGPLLTELFKNFNVNPDPYKDTVRMLLKIAIHQDDAERIVEYFEILKEKYPEIYISFEDTIKIGAAYRKIGEFERAYLVFRTTAQMNFILESKVAGNLEAEGKFLAACAFLKKLILEYPDLTSVEETYFDLSQMYYDKAGKPESLPELKEAGLGRVELLLEAATILKEYLLLYPQSPAAVEASFSLCNAFLDLEDYDQAVSFAKVCQGRYKESTFLDSFLYVEALGHFHLMGYEEALGLSREVAEGKFKDARGALRESENKNLAIYIMGQIYHSSGQPAQAIAEYEKVKEHYADAREAIHYFQKKAVSIPEVTTVLPGDEVKFTLKYRNIPLGELQVFKVDLMKYYLMERSLAEVAQINLAGISPLRQEKITLGEGKDYVEKKREINLPLEEEGAYFVLVRGDDLFSSGIILITPLEMEVEEDAPSGRVRVYIKDATSGKYKEKVEVKVIGSENREFISGKTDLRGIFIADGIVGKATVIARDEEDKYAFYRGEKFLGQRPPVAGVPVRGAAKPGIGGQVDYMSNIRSQNIEFQQDAIQRRQELYRQEVKGVQIEQLK